MDAFSIPQVRQTAFNPTGMNNAGVESPHFNMQRHVHISINLNL